jgi:hypothetical protein
MPVSQMTMDIVNRYGMPVSPMTMDIVNRYGMPVSQMTMDMLWLSLVAHVMLLLLETQRKVMIEERAGL